MTDDMTLNDALRALRGDRVIVRDGEPLDVINERLRNANTAPLAEPLEPAPRKKGDSMAISEALRRLAGKG